MKSDGRAIVESIFHEMIRLHERCSHELEIVHVVFSYEKILIVFTLRLSTAVDFLNLLSWHLRNKSIPLPHHEKQLRREMILLQMFANLF